MQLSNIFEFGYMHTFALTITHSSEPYNDKDLAILNRFFSLGQKIGFPWQQKNEITFKMLNSNDFLQNSSNFVEFQENNKSTDAWSLGQALGCIQQLPNNSDNKQDQEVKEIYTTGASMHINNLGLDVSKDISFEHIKDQLVEIDNNEEINTVININKIEGKNIQIDNDNTLIEGLTIKEPKEKITNSDITKSEKGKL